MGASSFNGDVVVAGAAQSGSPDPRQSQVGSPNWLVKRWIWRSNASNGENLCDSWDICAIRASDCGIRGIFVGYVGYLWDIEARLWDTLGKNRLFLNWVWLKRVGNFDENAVNGFLERIEQMIPIRRDFPRLICT